MKIHFQELKLTLLAAAFVGVWASPACAQLSNTYYDGPYNWAGLYAGVHFGGTIANFNHSTGYPGPAGDDDSFMGGGQVGYNWQVGNIVYGVEGDISGFDLDSDRNGTHFGEGWQSTYRGRLGYAYDRYLPYVTGGLGLTDVEAKINSSSSAVEPGYALGGGLETFVTKELIARVEYLYVDVPEDRFDIGNSALKGGAGDNTLRVGVSYKF